VTALSTDPVAVRSPGRPRLGGVLSDLLFGVRLSVAGRRSGWVRMLLAAIGTAVAVCVLLVAASLPHLIRAHDARELASSYVQGEPPIAGVAPLYIVTQVDHFHGAAIVIRYVSPAGPTSPVPPGLSRLPAPGEAAYSPALARLLAGGEGALLRPRYPFRSIGEIGNAGLTSPRELTAYIGAGRSPDASAIYRFGADDYLDAPLPRLLWALLLVGIVVLLFPIVVFVVTCSRLSGSQRDRRLAAIRLVGASAGQARLIAAAEALVAAPVGMLLGGGFFLAARSVFEHLQLFGLAPFARDVVPAPLLVALIAVAVPVLSVLAALVALRRTLIEPLGVVRDARPRRMRFWWRLVPPLVGVPLLYLVGQDTGSSGTGLVIGVVLLLLGIPLLLPWLVQRMLSRPRSETVALQLATGRLGVDAGTAARVVAGLAVVLAGAISFSTLLTAAASRYSAPPRDAARALEVDLDASLPVTETDRIAGRLRAAPGVTGVLSVRRASVAARNGQSTAVIASCPVLRAHLSLPSCVDGQVFLRDSDFVEPGEQIRLSADNDPARGPVRLVLPAGARTIPALSDIDVLSSDIYLTPAAARQVPAAVTDREILVSFDPSRPDTTDLIRDAVGPVRPQAKVYDPRPDDLDSEDVRTYRTIRQALFAGAVLTLAVAGATMLVLAIEQIRERRRPLAALAAAGVPRIVLTRSVLWQNAIPVALAVVLADVVGVVLGALLGPIASEPPTVDWGSIALLSALTVVVVAVVTALTLPSVRKATRPTMLRME
jgi:hypothetical protein